MSDRKLVHVETLNDVVEIAEIRGREAAEEAMTAIKQRALRGETIDDTVLRQEIDVRLTREIEAFSPEIEAIGGSDDAVVNARVMFVAGWSERLSRHRSTRH